MVRWEESKKPGLTRETFLALHHTCLALADCASYLLDWKGFNFVLLGHLQSDAIERRFGWLRQMSGANYYISMRQVLESYRSLADSRSVTLRAPSCGCHCFIALFYLAVRDNPWRPQNVEP